MARKCENLEKKSDLRRNDYILNTKRLYFALRNWEKGMKTSNTRYCVCLHNLTYILCHFREFDKIDDVIEEDG